MLEGLNLDTDLLAAAEWLDKPRVAAFVLPENRFLAVKAKDHAERRGIKKFIRPENADALLPVLPIQPGDMTHCVLRGDFVLCSIIPAIIGARGACDHVRIATLGMSTANAETLAALRLAAKIRALTVLASHYFSQVDRDTTFREVCSRFRDIATLAVARSHAKVILLPTQAGDHFVIEGSANLRSSDNLEQMLILNDAETFAFHAAWIDELAAKWKV